MAEIELDIKAYESLRPSLEENEMGHWVLIVGGELKGIFDNFDAAISEAATTYGAGPYLIRQVGRGDITLPASVMYRLV